jgi:hypothetical protein
VLPPEYLPSRPTPTPSRPSTGLNVRLKSGPLPPLGSIDTDDPAAAALRGAFPSRDRHPSGGHALIVPGFSILGELGAGGMGVVYLARQHDPDRPVALKVLRGGAFAGEAAHARLAEEARIVERLKHRDIVQLYEHGEVEGLPYLVLEYVAGPTLAKVSGGKPQDPRGAARVVERVARAVQYAHEQGVVHRDLKPANVLLQNDDRRPPPDDRPAPPPSADPAFDLRLSSVRPKITDFGLAKAVGETQVQTATGIAAGTPGYMAPEQATGDKARLGPWTDVFSLGVMLYELLTAKLPFRGDSPAALLFAPMSGRPVPFREYRRGLPADLETICLKCLAPEPRDRYLTAAELADDLQRFLDGRPVSARVAAGGRLAARRPAAVAAATVLLGLLCGGLAITTALYLRTDKARLSAEQQRAAAEAQADAARKLADEPPPLPPVTTPPPADGPPVRLDEAERVLAEVAADRERGLTGDDPKAVERAVRGLMALAQVSQATGRLDRAEKAAAAAAGQAEAAAGGTPTKLLAQALGLKADVLVARQPEQGWARADAAVTACRKAKDVAFLAYPPGDPFLFDRVAAEAAVLSALGKTAEAKRCVDMAIDVGRARFGPTHPKVQELTDRLAAYAPKPADQYAPTALPRAAD